MRILTKESFTSKEAYDTYKEEKKSTEVQIMVLCGLLIVASIMIIIDAVIW